VQPENVSVSVRLVVEVDASVYVNVAKPEESVITAVIGVSALRPAIVGVRIAKDLAVPKFETHFNLAVIVAPGATRTVLEVGETRESVPAVDTETAPPVTVTAEPAVTAAVQALAVNDL
jgi:hypothetical protein